MPDTPETKYFQIGFNRCGTTSMARFFERNDFATLHWEDGALARRMARNLREGAHILEGYADYRVFTDMEYVSDTEVIEAYKWYETILEQVPGARFILNTRDRDNWLRSRLNLSRRRGDGAYHQLYMRAVGLTDREALVELWLADWDAHHAAVRATIPADRLLVFNIETDPPERLCAFVGLPPSAARHFVSANMTHPPLRVRMLNRTPKRVLAALPQGLKDAVRPLFSRYR